MLSQFAVELLLEVGYKLLHDSVNLLVAHSLLRVLQHEVYSVRLLALRQFVALVNVEQLYLLQQFLLCLLSNLLHLGKLNVLVDQQSEVT